MNITGGRYNGRKIQAPSEKIVRPTLSKVRMSVFNTLYSLIGDFEGKSFLDMYGGSGIIGLEALSRGFSEVVVCEKNKRVSDIIKSNYSLLGIEPKLYIGDSIDLVKAMCREFDVIYIDPPYMSGIYEQSLKVLPKCSIIVLEHVTEQELSGYKLIKQKKIGDKLLTFLEG